MAITADAAALFTEPELVITRIFEAPRRLVFKMWTKPEHLVHWWGPRGFVTISSRMDVRPGGAWFRRLRAPDGSEHCKHGVYREVVAPERLVFTYVTDDPEGNLAPGTLVTVSFADLGGRTRVTLHQAAFQSVAARDDHRRGWTSALERFAAYLSANAV
ncbi:MAG: SRPBCC domain-containing protein [Alphaproteobacteria bacterium]|nr:SRPBCC domain-containing protein [Alphaproteobacteria bacterium]